MPRQAGTFVENSFVKGLITEATGLNFPEQAVTSTDNCVFDEKGIVRRRRGLDFELGYDTREGTLEDRVVTSYRWDAAAGDGDNSIIVVQAGGSLLFYLTDEGAVSDNLIDTLDLTPYATNSIDDIRANECQFAAGKGYLFVANSYMESIYVSFNTDTQTVTANQIALTIRDFEGVEDGLDINERPTVLSDEHEYNLHNQGWNTHILEQSGGDPEGYPLDLWETDLADYPSNADTVWIHMLADGFNPSTAPLKDRLTTPAPKGHFVLDYYDPDRDSLTPLDTDRSWTGLTSSDSGHFRASTIEFFAGRVWYAGVKGTGFSNRILFSQIIERDSQIGQCFQVNDPTSEDLFDLLPSDGGVILIPDSGTIVKLFAFEDSVLIFTTNGCWKVAGSEGVGFRANDYSVVKISAIPCLTAASFVSITGTPSFWNSEGIYLMSANETTGSSTLASITDTTIKTFFQNIPLQTKSFAKGCFNRRTGVITWVYKSETSLTVAGKYSFDRILQFNTLSQAFYNWSVDISDVAIKSVVVALSEENIATPTIVTDSALATVTDAALETVYAMVPEAFAGDVTKFLVSFTSGDEQITFADEQNETYVDWYSFDDIGTNYDSHFITGYKIHGDGLRKMQPTYVNLFFKTDSVDSSIDFRSIWQYANTGSTGRWSTAQRLVTISNDYDYIRKRIKARGSGVVYQFRVDSVDGEPFHLIGWSVFETSNSQV